MIKMVSPVEGYTTSEFGWRTLAGKRNHHNGLDIATGGKTSPVYAVFAGMMRNCVYNRVNDKTFTQLKNLGKKRVRSGTTGNGCEAVNPDGEVQTYIHMKPIVKDGQWVEMGQHIGNVDLSGYSTGYHLHLEMRTAGGVLLNPRVWFDYHGIKPGSRPIRPSAPSVSKSTQVQNWQRTQNKYGKAGLLEDGVKGSYSVAWENWVKQLQTAMRAWRGVPNNLVIDGDYGAITNQYVATIQKNNNLYADGFAQAKTIAYMRRHGSNVPDRPRTRL